MFGNCACQIKARIAKPRYTIYFRDALFMACTYGSSLSWSILAWEPGKLPIAIWNPEKKQIIVRASLTLEKG